VEEVWIRAYEGCFSNVDQYIKDIISLEDSGSHGHAFALTIIAQEEISKALCYFLIGLLRETKEGKPFSEKLLSKIHASHLLKIMLGNMTVQIGKAIKKGVSKAQKELDALKQRARAGESVERLTREALYRYALPQIKQIHKGDYLAEMSETSEKLQMLKEKGSYVDVSAKKVSTPLEIKKEEMIKELEKLKENYHVAKWLIQFVSKYPEQFVPVVVPQAIEIMEEMSEINI
jgi:AbiV family abortive infection protein